MIEFVKGDLLAADVECYVNPVNCVGVSGAGLAKEFKEAFPESYEDYRYTCKEGKGKLFRPGEVMFFTEEIFDGTACQVAYFATKDHWKDPSQMVWIARGLQSLAFQLDRFGISSVAVPALGCGLGGLEWKAVREMMLKSDLNRLKNCRVLVYEPHE